MRVKKAPGAAAHSTTKPAGKRAHLVRAKRVPELVASDIRQQLIKGDLLEGSRLPPETEMMAQYQISRPTLREALRLLESESLIVVQRGGIGGATVRRPSLDSTARTFSLVLQMSGATVSQVYQARLAIEPFALSEMARNAGHEELKKLEQGVEKLQQTIGNASAYSHQITQVREFMILTGGNVALMYIARLIDNMLERYTTTVGESRASQDRVNLQRRSLRSFQKLLTLMKAKDASGVEQHWRRHLKQVEADLFEDERPIEIVDLLQPSEMRR